jgi:hypothetical protein
MIDYTYTLNFYQALGDDLVAAIEGYRYLKSLPSGHPDKATLTPELEASVRALVAFCEEFSKTYTQYQTK